MASCTIFDWCYPMRMGNWKMLKVTDLWSYGGISSVKSSLMNQKSLDFELEGLMCLIWRYFLNSDELFISTLDNCFKDFSLTLMETRFHWSSFKLVLYFDILPSVMSMHWCVLVLSWVLDVPFWMSYIPSWCTYSPPWFTFLMYLMHHLDCTVKSTVI